MTNSDRWLGLEIRHLAALQAVAEERGFARAAVSLGYTQSAISQQISALERIVGDRLIDRPRGRRPVGLTPAGEALLSHANVILARVRAAQADMEATKDTAQQPLRIGTYQSVAVHILPGLLRLFRPAWPNVQVILHERATDLELFALVEQGELDLIFCTLPAPDGPFETEELLADPYFLVVQSGSPLARRGTAPTIEDIGATPLIGFRSCRNEQRIEAELFARGLTRTVVFRSNDNATIQAMVAAGQGAALMPRLTIDPAIADTVLFDAGHMFPPRLLAACWHSGRERHAASAAFVEMAHEVASTVDRQAATPTASSYRGRSELDPADQQVPLPAT